MRGALKSQGFFSLNGKIIYKNRLTFVKVCGILKLPLDVLLIFFHCVKPLKVGGMRLLPMMKNAGALSWGRKHIRNGKWGSSPQFFAKTNLMGNGVCCSPI